MIKPNDITHVRYRGHWIKRDSKKFVELIGKPDLLAKTLTMINKVENRATEYLDSSLLYPVNGKHYKPKWADNGGTYWGLFQRDDKVVEKGRANSTVKWKKLTGNVIKEIYVPGRIVNLVVK